MLNSSRGAVSPGFAAAVSKKDDSGMKSKSKISESCDGFLEL